MEEREEIIKDYFQFWINNNCKTLRGIFDTKVIYNECYGPEYRGVKSIESWFKDWNKRGTVLLWNIKQFIHSTNITVVEWYFKCEYDGEISEFMVCHL